ncbi:hypothetical protein [Halorubellus salinus]|uniref:hypothetical protein n=1 Tax=Halorubellus salinus TaxID=755309 RepID=UPI001D06A9AC|nr:hypothetical protein [Halorubellus salinus]
MTQLSIVINDDGCLLISIVKRRTDLVIVGDGHVQAGIATQLRCKMVGVPVPFNVLHIDI